MQQDDEEDNGVRLHDLTKDEFREVARDLRPDLDDKEYDCMWEDFQVAKTEGRLTPPH